MRAPGGCYASAVLIFLWGLSQGWLLGIVTFVLFDLFVADTEWRKWGK